MYAAPHCISARAWTFKVPVSGAEIVKTEKMRMQDVFNNTTRNVLLRLMFYVLRAPPDMFPLIVSKSNGMHTLLAQIGDLTINL